MMMSHERSLGLYLSPEEAYAHYSKIESLLLCHHPQICIAYKDSGAVELFEPLMSVGFEDMIALGWNPCMPIGLEGLLRGAQAAKMLMECIESHEEEIVE